MSRQKGRTLVVISMRPRELDAAKLLQSYHYPDGEVIPIDRSKPLRSLRQILEKYSHIDRLVIISHGGPYGHLLMGNQRSGSPSISLKSIAERWKKFEHKLPKINKIVFEGCRVAKGGDEAIRNFGRLFGGAKIKAWKQKHILAYVANEQRYQRYAIQEIKKGKSFWIEFYVDKENFKPFRDDDPFPTNHIGITHRSESFPEHIISYFRSTDEIMDELSK